MKHLLVLLACIGGFATAHPGAYDPNWVLASQPTYHGNSIGGMSWGTATFSAAEQVAYMMVVKPSSCHPASTISVAAPLPAQLHFIKTVNTLTDYRVVISVNHGVGANLPYFSVGYNGQAFETCPYLIYKMTVQAVTPPPQGLSHAAILLNLVSVNGVVTHQWAYESCYEAIRRQALNILDIDETSPFRLRVVGDAATIMHLPETLSCVESISWND